MIQREAAEELGEDGDSKNQESSSSGIRPLFVLFFKLDEALPVLSM